jgi:hypothetical protein
VGFLTCRSPCSLDDFHDAPSLWIETQNKYLQIKMLTTRFPHFFLQTVCMAVWEVAQSVKWLDAGHTAGVRLPPETVVFPFATTCGLAPLSIHCVRGSLTSEVRRQEHEDDHLSGTEVKTCGSSLHPPPPPYVFIAFCLCTEATVLLPTESLIIAHKRRFISV